MVLNHPDSSWIIRMVRFLRWVLPVIFHKIPEAERAASLARPVSHHPIWLAQGNPLANYPFEKNPAIRLPLKADIVVIGAGFTGVSIAYHASHRANHRWVVLDQADPASGASGRNAGVVVMGRYFQKIYASVLKNLARDRPDLTSELQDKLAGQFAQHYVQAAYKNADMIERTIQQEGYDCDYQRRGWIQARDLQDQQTLQNSVHMSQYAGFDDWRMLTSTEVVEKSGMQVTGSAGYSN